mmetsp:Transcript_6012/g.18565  ORF Transcript_6012/g.18565 Transcript_6012/m.18565 type:complete len:363 (-) Transcript_6012:679-1767(-)
MATRAALHHAAGGRRRCTARARGRLLARLLVHRPQQRREAAIGGRHASELLAARERRDHAERVLRLVHRDHVAGLVDLDKRQPSRRSHGATRGAAPGGPLGLRRRRPLLGARPLETVDPARIAKPVANEVEVAGVDHDAHAILQHLGQQQRVVAKPIARKVAVHHHVARLPGLVDSESLLCGLHVEEGVSVAEVVAQRAVALLLDVVHVDTWVRREDGPKLGAHADAEAKAAQPPPLRRLARVCHEGADWRPKFDDVVQRLRDELILQRKVGVRGELHVGLCQPVSNSNALHVDLLSLASLAGGPDAVSHNRDVVASVGLSRHVERTVGELRVGLKELLQEIEHVVGDLLLIKNTIHQGRAV